jgi:hypothetical protein
MRKTIQSAGISMSIIIIVCMTPADWESDHNSCRTGQQCECLGLSNVWPIPSNQTKRRKSAAKVDGTGKGL